MNIKAAETCSVVVPEMNLVNFFLFNNGLQAICQKARNESTSDNSNLCANDSFFMAAMQKSSVSEIISAFSSYSTGVVFTNKQSSKFRTITLDKIYKAKVLSGIKEIVIKPGTYQMNCQGK